MGLPNPFPIPNSTLTFPKTSLRPFPKSLYRDPSRTIFLSDSRRLSSWKPSGFVLKPARIPGRRTSKTTRGPTPAARARRILPPPAASASGWGEQFPRHAEIARPWFATSRPKPGARASRPIPTRHQSSSPRRILFPLVFLERNWFAQPRQRLCLNPANPRDAPLFGRGHVLKEERHEINL